MSSSRRSLFPLLFAALLAPSSGDLLHAGPADFFRGSIEYSVRGRVAALASGDLDSDGSPDVVLAYDGSPAIDVLRGTGSAELPFRAAVSHDVGGGAVHIAIGDVDGRLGPDLFVVNSGSSSVSLLLNRGDGTFGDAREFPVGLGPRVGQLADLDGDGALDAVTTNLASFDVHVLLGDGVGGFAEVQRLRVGDNPHYVVVADFDGDRVPDVAVAHRDDRLTTGAVSCFRGRGDGTFDAAVVTDLAEVDVVPRIIAQGDLDGDGDADLAVLTSKGGLLLLANRGACEFDVTVLGEGSGRAGVGFFDGFLISSDFDGDRVLDLVAPIELDGNSGFRVHRGSGDGAFDALDVFLDGPVSHLATGDFTGDGAPDVLVAWADRPALGIVPGLSGGGLATRSVVRTDAPPRAIAVSDFDGDRHGDIVVMGPSSVQVFRSVAPSSPWETGLSALRSVALEGRALQDVAAGDFDRAGSRAGRAEVVVSDLAGGEVVVLRPDADGAVERVTAWSVDPLPTRLASGDLDGDGRLDLVVAHRAGTTVTVILAAGDEPDPARRATLDVGAAQTSLVVGAIDAGPTVDLAVSTRSALVVRAGDGRGGFSGDAAWPDLSGAQAVRVASIGGSTVGDLVLTLGQRLVVAIDVTSPGARIESVELGTEIRPLAVADVDADGLDDVITASPDAVHVLAGDPNALLSPPRAYRVGLSPLSLAITDVDRDGALDCVSADFGSRALSVLHGRRSRVPADARLRRGDVDGSGAVQLTDAVFLLDYLFRGGPPPPCDDAADANDDGGANLADAVTVLDYLFRGGRRPPDPGPDGCGLDPTPDSLSCMEERCSG